MLFFTFTLRSLPSLFKVFGYLHQVVFLTNETIVTHKYVFVCLCVCVRFFAFLERKDICLKV